MAILAIVLAFLVLGSAIFASFEISLFSLPQVTLRSYENSNQKGKKLIFQIMQNPRDVLVVILLFNVLIGILIQNTFANLFEDKSWVYKVIVPLAFILIFGEIIPKSIGLKRNVLIAPISAKIIKLLMRILRPILQPLVKTTAFVSRFLFFFLHKEQAVSLEELRHVVRTSRQEGVLLSDEADFIEGAIDLQDSMVQERMRPRNEILFYEIQDPLEELERLFVDMQATRIPVCDGSLENVLGILNLREYFLFQAKVQKPQDLIEFLHKPTYAHETLSAWNLLMILREKDQKIALVVDEYGSISGLITQEDLIEAVVGEIKDRRDFASLYTRSGPDVIIASGKLELSEFEEIFGIALPTKSHKVTLGGWLTEMLGDIPSAGTKFQYSQFLFHVLSSQPQRIKRIYVRRLKSRKD